MRFFTSVFALGLALAPMAANAQVGVQVGGQVAIGQAVYTTVAPPAPVAENPGNPPGPGFAWVAGFWNWNGSQHVWTPGRWDRPPQAAQAWEPAQWERDQRGYRFRPGRWGNRGMGGQQGFPGGQPQGFPNQPQGFPNQPQGFPNQPQGYPPVPVAQPVQQPGYPQVPMAVPVGQPSIVNPGGGVVFVPRAPPRPRFERRTPPPQRGQTWVPGFWTWNGAQHTWTAGHWEAPPRARAQWVAPRWVRRGNQWQMTPGRWR